MGDAGWGMRIRLCGEALSARPHPPSPIPHPSIFRRTKPRDVSRNSHAPMTRRLTPTSEKPHRDFLQIPDLSAKEIEHLFALAERMRAGKYKKRPLAGKSMAMIFMKSS